MSGKKMLRARRKKGKRSRSRRIALRIGFAVLAILAVWGVGAEWFVHHPRPWLDVQREKLPALVTAPLLWLGNPLADITDAVGWTGHDAVYEYDTEAPAGSTIFAGAPVRTGAPAPDDIKVVDRGEFMFGWSDRLRHPVWCAYHVTKDAKYTILKRPGFVKDRAIPAAPTSAAYTKSGYDRGHLAPNHAIASRYGEDAQKKTFMMSNVAPQTPALNRGVWRDVEHRIADFWTARYGEIWVVVGCILSGNEAISGTGDADLIAIARTILYDPRWPWHAAAHLGASVKAAPQYLRCQPRQYRNLFDAPKGWNEKRGLSAPFILILRVFRVSRRSRLLRKRFIPTGSA